MEEDVCLHCDRVEALKEKLGMKKDQMTQHWRGTIQIISGSRVGKDQGNGYFCQTSGVERSEKGGGHKRKP